MTDTPQKNWFLRHKIITGLIILFIIGGILPDPAPTNAPATAEAPKEVKARPARKTVTMDEFKAIKNGMSLEEVQELVGAEGVMNGESQFGSINTAMYDFTGDEVFSSVMITIQNGRVSMKNQFGLK